MNPQCIQFFEGGCIGHRKDWIEVLVETFLRRQLRLNNGYLPLFRGGPKGHLHRSLPNLSRNGKCGVRRHHDEPSLHPCRNR